MAPPGVAMRRHACQCSKRTSFGLNVIQSPRRASHKAAALPMSSANIPATCRHLLSRSWCYESAPSVHAVESQSGYVPSSAPRGSTSTALILQVLSTIYLARLIRLSICKPSFRVASNTAGSSNGTSRSSSCFIAARRRMLRRVRPSRRGSRASGLLQNAATHRTEIPRAHLRESTISTQIPCVAEARS